MATMASLVTLHKTPEFRRLQPARVTAHRTCDSSIRWSTQSTVLLLPSVFSSFKLIEFLFIRRIRLASVCIHRCVSHDFRSALHLCTSVIVGKCYRLSTGFYDFPSVYYCFLSIDFVRFHTYVPFLVSSSCYLFKRVYSLLANYQILPVLNKII